MIVEDPFEIPVGRGRAVKFTKNEELCFGLSSSFNIKLAVRGHLLEVEITSGGRTLAGKLNIPVHRFVDFFASNWQFLWIERAPRALRYRDLINFEKLLSSSGENEVPAIAEFAQRHRLETCNSEMSPIWFIRSNREMVLVTRSAEGYFRFPIGMVMNPLERACSVLSQYIAENDEEHSGVVSKWSLRNKSLQKFDLLAAFTNVNEEQLLTRLAGAATIADYNDLLNHNSEILAAARMRPAGMSNDDLIVILDTIERVEKMNVTELDRLSAEAEQVLQQWIDFPPWEQGRKLAIWARDALRLGVGPIYGQLNSILGGLSVQLLRVSLTNTQLEAFAFWGPRHGPAVVINMKRRARINPVRIRTILGHELCHLIVDRHGALPLGEMLGGVSLPELEQRASSFAVEFLLPVGITRERLHKHHSNAHELNDALLKLCKSYGVSRQAVGYQLRRVFLEEGVIPDQWVRAYIQTISPPVTRAAEEPLLQ